MTHDSPPRAWIEVDQAALVDNLLTVKNALDGAAVMPVVKANAYGHGLETVARAWDACGITFFGVANPGEARRLHQAEVHTGPFILGPAFPDEREEIVAHGWRATVSTLQEAAHYESLGALYGKTVPLHLCVDTGMGRAGFLPGEWSEAASALARMPHLCIEGLVSHFPSADEDEAFTREEIAVFEGAYELLNPVFHFKYRHIAASAGALAFHVPCANLARPGLVLYGVSPVDSPLAAEVKPALRLLSRVTLVRTLPAGHGVAYGRTWVTPRPTRVATIGIGYADGWMRCLSNAGARVSINGHTCPLLGRVTMDQVMADVTDAPGVHEGDAVEMIGPNIPLVEIAERAGTIPWEILTGLGPRLPRVFL